MAKNRKFSIRKNWWVGVVMALMVERMREGRNLQETGRASRIDCENEN